MNEQCLSPAMFYGKLRKHPPAVQPGTSSGQTHVETDKQVTDAIQRHLPGVRCLGENLFSIRVPAEKTLFFNNYFPFSGDCR